MWVLMGKIVNCIDDILGFFDLVIVEFCCMMVEVVQKVVDGEFVIGSVLLIIQLLIVFFQGVVLKELDWCEFWKENVVVE